MFQQPAVLLQAFVADEKLLEAGLPPGVHYVPVENERGGSSITPSPTAGTVRAGRSGTGLDDIQSGVGVGLIGRDVAILPAVDDMENTVLVDLRSVAGLANLGQGGALRRFCLVPLRRVVRCRSVAIPVLVRPRSARAPGR